MAFFERNFEFLSAIKEAEGDDANAIMNTDVDDTGAANAPDTANADDANPAPNTDEAGEAESADDDDFNINVDMDDMDDPNSGDAGEGNSDDNFDTHGTDGSGSTNTGNDGNKESNKANTDIFSMLTAEEQSIKIMELKKLYNTLYTSCDDLLDKIHNISIDNMDIRIISRVTDSMYQLKNYIKDYILDSFPIKSYYENDVMYNRFLTIFTTISAVFDDVYKLNDHNSDKKN